MRSTCAIAFDAFLVAAPRLATSAARAEAGREAHRDWRDARRQEHRAQDDQGGYVIGR